MATNGWSRRSVERRLDSPNVAVVVGEDVADGVAEASQVVRQELGLVTSELEQDHSAAAKKRPGLVEHAPEDVGAVRTAVVRHWRLERERVSLKERQLGGGHIRNNPHDQVGAAYELRRQRREKIALIHIDAVRTRTCDGTLVDFGRSDTGAGAVRAEDRRDCTGSCAEVDGHPVIRQPFDGPSCQRLAEPSGDVHVRINSNAHPTERDLADNPCQGLAGEPASNCRIEEFEITAGIVEQLARLLFGRDEALASQQCAERPRVVPDPSVREA